MSAENPEPVEKIEGAAAGADSIASPKATDSSQVVVEATPTSEQASTGKPSMPPNHSLNVYILNVYI